MLLLLCPRDAIWGDGLFILVAWDGLYQRSLPKEIFHVIRDIILDENMVTARYCLCGELNVN